ncbi:MAG: zinc ribbon domain-containing protein [Halanaeroarchaeum sp.]
MHAVPAYCLTCPDCGEEIVVDEGLRDPLLDTGCIVCGGPLSPDDFERL